MGARIFDIAVVGAGIVGLASALEVQARTAASLLLVEAEKGPAKHQSGHNSGVVHSGLYYRPGSVKATHCARGRERLAGFCAQYDIPVRRCGKLIVATRTTQLEALEQLRQRGQANGLQGLRRLRGDQLAEFEPHAAGLAGLWVPETGVVDFALVAARMAQLVQERGGRLECDARLSAVRRSGAVLELVTNRGVMFCRHLVACAGLMADRVAHMCAIEPGLAILPFRGEYHELVPQSRHLVRNLLYPVPDPRLPFLGVHFTRRIDGRVEVGPNAVLALSRHGYRRGAFSARDLREMACHRGSWRLARRHWRSGLAELRRAIDPSAFLAQLREMVPALAASDLRRAGAGVRAMAVDGRGQLLDDFRIVQGERMIHVLNAPSPAATAAFAIGETIAEMAVRDFELGR